MRAWSAADRALRFEPGLWMKAPAPEPSLRDGYRRFLAIPTRWEDNDTYGHVNNVVYYSYFDTAVNQHLIAEGGLDIVAAPAVGLVVETMCKFRKPLSFPDIIDAGLRVTKIGTSSVRYEIGLFREGDDEPAATGHFVHVWVDRATQRPVPVPPTIRAALEALVAERGE
jgi:acyl-CoA thioester hydrolase